MSGTNRRWSRIGTAFLAVPILALAACSPSGDGDSSGSSFAGANPADSSKSTVTIGVAAPLSGPFADVSGTAVPAAEAWADWVNNEQGGVNGHPVAIVAKDTKSSAAEATSALTEMVEQDKVVAVVVADAAIEAPMATYLSNADMPVIGAIGNDPGVWLKYPNYFGTFALTDVIGQANLLAATIGGVTKFGAMVCAEVPVCAELDGAYKAAAPEFGLDYAGYVTVKASAPSYTGECLTMINKGVQEIILSLGAATIQRVVRDCNQQGFNGYYGISSTSVSAKSFAETDGLKAIGAIGQFPWWSTAAPVEQFRTVMEVAGVDNYTTPAATGTWASLELFRKALTNVGDQVTTDDIFDAYWQIKNETLDGLLAAPVTFTKGQPAVGVHCAWLYTYEDGTFTTQTSDTAGNGAEGDLASSCLS